MVTIPLGYVDGDSKNENLARIRMKNMYITSNGYTPDQKSRFSRPTLTAYKEISSLPVYGIWQQQGTLDNTWLVICGETLYKVLDDLSVVEIGAIPGTEVAQFAGTTDRVIITRNGVAYSTDGSSVTQIIMPDNRAAGSVACIDNTFLISQRDTQRFYWIFPGQTDPDPLSFASAERTPDSVRSINVISDEVWFLGAIGVEVWQTTGDADAHYQRIAGRVYSDGCLDAATACTASYNGYPCLLWVTEKRSVIMAQGNPVKVSTKSVEDVLKSSTNFRAWTFRWNQHDFYVLTCDEQTLVFDLSNQLWSKWESFGFNNWRAHLGIQINEKVYAGDSEHGIIWELEDGYSDNGQPVVREVSGFVISQASGEQCSSVNVRINAGWPPEYTHTPVLEMRWSDDYGFSWTKFFPVSMGRKGVYEYDVTYRSLGSFERPGRDFEFRFSDIGKFRIDYATMNEV